MILVDTSVLIDFFGAIYNPASEQLIKILENNIPFGITSIIYQEILQGAKNEREFNKLKTYLGTQVFYNVKDPVKSYEDAAKIYFRLKKKGITIRSTIDCLIAQIALDNNLYLLHNDDDYTKMAEVVDLKVY